jgi:superfamily II DNA or RNA helicase
MKQANLQQTETKQIVLATYAMAAEALDIKTLSTLVMVTPKTDITQSVGRILRVKHEKPIIVDIIDSHDIFQNQWAQRRRFYKKSNYRIREIDSKKYTNMMIDWNEDKIWKRVFEPKDNNSCGNVDNEEKEHKSIFDGKCLINISNLS